MYIILRIKFYKQNLYTYLFFFLSFNFNPRAPIPQEVLFSYSVLYIKAVSFIIWYMFLFKKNDEIRIFLYSIDIHYVMFEKFDILSFLTSGYNFSLFKK